MVAECAWKSGLTCGQRSPSRDLFAHSPQFMETVMYAPQFATRTSSLLLQPYPNPILQTNPTGKFSLQTSASSWLHAGGQCMDKAVQCPCLLKLLHWLLLIQAPTKSHRGRLSTVSTAGASMHYVSSPSHFPSELFGAVPTMDKRCSLVWQVHALGHWLARETPMASGKGHLHGMLCCLEYLLHPPGYAIDMRGPQ